MNIFNRMEFDPDQPIKVLDLGCGDCSFLFNFYNNFDLNYSRIDAIDSDRDPVGVKKFGPVDLSIKYSNTVFLEPKKELNSGVMIFELQKAYDFLDNIDTIYDVIILNNFLHCLETKDEAKKHVQKCLKNLSMNGYLFISIATVQHPNIDESKNHKGPKWDSSKEEVIEWTKPIKLICCSQVNEKLNYYLFKNET